MPVTEKLRVVSQRFRGFVRSNLKIIVVAGVSVLVGIGLAAGYATALDYTSSLNFCAHTCHEMESTVFQEYMQSKHYKNEQGVVVVCAQCHVPHDNWPAVLGRKAMRARAVDALRGLRAARVPMASRGPFKQRRFDLAKRVWAAVYGEQRRRMQGLPQIREHGPDGPAAEYPRPAHRRDEDGRELSRLPQRDNPSHTGGPERETRAGRQFRHSMRSYTA